ncbi:MAG: hypothetical protein M1479_05955 [Actinobacteria bacterium]|nr:hypothetical protein [Actinomycetota bacterium]
MSSLCKRLLTIFIYVISIIALVIILIGLIKNEKPNYIDNDQIVKIVPDIYSFIDDGKFEKLYDIVLEGKWKSNSEIGKKKIYVLDGILDRDSFLKQNIDDFGYNGWRINFNSLEILNVENIELQKFKEEYFKEWIILKKYNSANSANNNLYIVTVKGYTIGSCSIVNWEKKLPIFFDGKYWKAIVTGTPEDLKAIHKEQWLTEINFNSN